MGFKEVKVGNQFEKIGYLFGCSVVAKYQNASTYKDLIQNCIEVARSKFKVGKVLTLIEDLSYNRFFLKSYEDLGFQVPQKFSIIPSFEQSRYNTTRKLRLDKPIPVKLLNEERGYIERVWTEGVMDYYKQHFSQS